MDEVGKKRAEVERSAWDVATAGTYVDTHVPRALLAAVLAIALVVAAVPSVGMLWARTDSTAEGRELVGVPTLFDGDGGFNGDVLADAGAYLDDHFAYRNELVTLNARIRAALGVSSTDQVVVGKGGWLYYGGTLPDYLGQSEMSDRALRNVAHNLALAQSYVESRGATFAFAIAPNKNSLYPQHMPYYYVESPEAGNASRLAPLLDEAGVNHVDLFGMFGEADGEWYLEGDSHWDNRGALMAAQMILAALGHEPIDLNVGDAAARDDFVGDLSAMLYPADSGTEENWYFSGYDDGEGMSGALWSYAEGADVTDSWIRTSSDAGAASLVMFRDSFGNALVPLLAPSFREAAFSKLVPYNLPVLSQVGADTVVIERAERHLDYLASNPPIMPSPEIELDVGASAGVDTGDSADVEAEATTLAASSDGPYWKLEGVACGSVLSDESLLCVFVETADGETRAYDASWKTVAAAEGTEGAESDFGYQVYVGKGDIDLRGATVSIYAVEGDASVLLKSFEGIESFE